MSPDERSVDTSVRRWVEGSLVTGSSSAVRRSAASKVVMVGGTAQAVAAEKVARTDWRRLRTRWRVRREGRAAGVVEEKLVFEGDSGEAEGGRGGGSCCDCCSGSRPSGMSCLIAGWSVSFRESASDSVSPRRSSTS